MTTTKPSESYARLWLFVLAVSAILLITIGTRMSLGLFVQPLVKNTSMSIAQVSLAIAVTQLMWGVSQPLSGMLSDRFGAWYVLCGGTLMLVVGWLLMPHMVNVWGLTFTMGLLVAFGMGAGSWSILMSLIANRVPMKMRGTASGVANAGGSIGQMLMAPLLQGVISIPTLGWQGAMYMMAGISLLILPISYKLTGGQAFRVVTTKPSEQGKQTITQAVKQAFADRSYWLTMLGFMTCGFHVAFLSTHLPTEIAICGLPATVASTSLAIIGIANLIGSLIVGWCVGKFRSKYVLFTLYATRVLLVLLYINAPRTDINFYLFAAGLGLSWLATVPPTVSLIGKLFGTRYLATLFGLTLFSHQIGGFLGSFLGGKAITAFGDYGWMWYADIALASAAALMMLPIREKKVQEI